MHLTGSVFFALRIIFITTDYMSVFFHELGHTISAWIYGYPTIPMFDFNYGGGFSYSPTGQKYIIIGLVDIGIIYLIYLARGYIFIQALFAISLVLHLVTSFTDFHRNIIDFMGPASTPLIASFFLTRALLNITIKNDTERFLNAFFGFSFIFSRILDCISLMKNDAYRLVYYQQKGSHGFGDLDKIAENINYLSFNGVVTILLIVNIAALTLPFAIYVIRQR